jgi:hypothetical protein
VRARLIVIRRISGKNSPQVHLAEDYHLIQALAAQCADQTFSTVAAGSLPRTALRPREFPVLWEDRGKFVKIGRRRSLKLAENQTMATQFPVRRTMNFLAEKQDIRDRNASAEKSASRHLADKSRVRGDVSC